MQAAKDPAAAARRDAMVPRAELATLGFPPAVGAIKLWQDQALGNDRGRSPRRSQPRLRAAEKVAMRIPQRSAPRAATRRHWSRSTSRSRRTAAPASGRTVDAQARSFRATRPCPRCSTRMILHAAALAHRIARSDAGLEQIASSVMSMPKTGYPASTRALQSRPIHALASVSAATRSWPRARST
jgi:hypothetical protein